MAEKKKVSLLEELRGLDEKALHDRIAELRKELVEQHRSLAAQELPNPRVIANNRKEIAKALTVISEKQSAPKEEEK